MFLSIRERILRAPLYISRGHLDDLIFEISESEITLENPKDHEVWSEIFEFTNRCIVLGFAPKSYEVILTYIRTLSVFEDSDPAVLAHACWVMLATMVPRNTQFTHSLIARRRRHAVGDFSARILEIIEWINRKSDKESMVGLVTSGWMPTGSLYIRPADSILLNRIKRYIIPPEAHGVKKPTLWFPYSPPSKQNEIPSIPLPEKRATKSCLCF
jgi:hypothetical protein